MCLGNGGLRCLTGWPESNGVPRTPIIGVQRPSREPIRAPPEAAGEKKRNLDEYHAGSPCARATCSS